MSRGHPLSAGVVVVRRVSDRCLYLVLRAYQYWDFPKGMVEPGESALEAAKREVAEETSIRDLRFLWGDGYRETLPYRQGKVARYFVASTEQTSVELPVNPELGRPEHHEFRWAAYEEAHALLPPRVQPILQWARDVTGCRKAPTRGSD